MVNSTLHYVNVNKQNHSVPTAVGTFTVKHGHRSLSIDIVHEQGTFTPTLSFSAYFKLHNKIIQHLSLQVSACYISIARTRLAVPFL